MFEITPFRVHHPTTMPCPIVVSIPHSGLVVPEEMKRVLNPKYRGFLPHQDWHLDKLYAELPALGITVLAAVYSRYVVDLNRVAKAPFIGSFWQAAVPKQTAYGQPLYRVLPSRQQVQDRINQVYQPYHQQLEHLLQEIVDKFGHAYLLDLHSFAGPISDQVCLGNANGQTCSEDLMSAIESAFSSQSYQVVRNHVFNGGYITRRYGNISSVESLQIEFRYHNYLNLEQLEQERIPDWEVPEFYRAKQRIQDVFSYLVKFLREDSYPSMSLQVCHGDTQR